MKYVAKNRTVWYLHRKPIVLPRNKVNSFAYTFKKEKGEGYLEELPIHLMVFEARNGYPMVKRK